MVVDEEPTLEGKTKEQTGSASTPVSSDPVWSILPSYYMYSNTINTGINDKRPDPPTYDVSSRPSITSSLTSGSAGPFENSTVSTAATSTAGGQSSRDSAHTLDEYQDQDAHIKENLLDNIHKLKNLTSSGNVFADAVDISIVFTEEIAVGNRPSKVIDPSVREFHQGDYINGFVIIKNNGTVPIPFDMFYFVLEGEFRTETNLHFVNPTSNVKTFLQMFDFNASYNEADINRLVNHNESFCSTIVLNNNTYEYDPFDKTVMCLGNRMIYPNIPYKRFFTFKIPSKLLDSTCLDGGLSAHVALPPSFGGEIKDFAPFNGFVKYGVWARFIGRHSKYKTDILPDDDEFVVLKDTGKTFRVSPFSNIETDYSHSKRSYNEFFREVNERLKEGNDLLFPKNATLSPVQSPNGLEKDGSIKNQITRTRNESLLYEFYIPVYKTTPFQKISLCSMLQVITPRKVYTLAYIPPEKFRVSQSLDSSSWKLDIPFEISVSTGSKNKFIDIKTVSAELVVTTMESDKYPLPVEMHHDLLFNQFKPRGMLKNFVEDEDNLHNNLITPSKNLYLKMYNLLNSVAAAGLDWKVEKRIALGIKAIAKMNIKVINLEIKGTRVSKAGDCRSVKDIPWEETAGRMTKRFDVQLDITTAVMKSTNKKNSKTTSAFNDFTLVPNFQSCHVCRIYYVRVILGLSNGQNAYVKLPVNVENRPL